MHKGKQQTARWIVSGRYQGDLYPGALIKLVSGKNNLIPYQGMLLSGKNLYPGAPSELDPSRGKLIREKRLSGSCHLVLQNEPHQWMENFFDSHFHGTSTLGPWSGGRISLIRAIGTSIREAKFPGRAKTGLYPGASVLVSGKFVYPGSLIGIRVPDAIHWAVLYVKK